MKMNETVRLGSNLIQWAVAMTLIGLIFAPQLSNGISYLDTTIHGRQITLEGTVTDRYGNRIPHATVTIVRNDGVPYKDEDGKPVRSLTDTKGVYKLETTVNGDYRLEIVLPRQQIR